MNVNPVPANGLTAQYMADLRNGAYPKGFPFVTGRAWNPALYNGTSVDCIAVEHGEEGFIHGEVGRDDNGNMAPDAFPGWYHIVLPRRQAEGVVPAAILNVGTRKYGDIQYNLHIPPPPQNVLVAPGNTLFEKTVKSLLNAIYNNSEAFSILPESMKSHIDTHQKIEDLVSVLVQGIRGAGLWDLMKDGNFTMQDLKNRGRAFPQGDTRGGVYMRAYWDFVDEDDNTITDAYIGMTLHFWLRHLQHLNETPTSDKLHYRQARKAQRDNAFPLCIYGGDSEAEKELRLIFEQIFILLFQAYNKNLTASLRPTLHAFAIKAACIYSQIAKGVFENTGWQVGSDQDAFGLRRGYNWESPVSGNIFERQPIVRSVIPGRYELYRMPRNCTEVPRCGTVGAYRKITKIKSGTTIAQFPHLVVDGNNVHDVPPPGPVDVVFEIAMDADGQPVHHPVPYSNLPTVGAPKSWDLALSVGVRVEWQENGHWKEKYIFMTSANGLNRPSSGYRAHKIVVGIVRYLRRQRITGKSSDTLDLGLANVWDFEFDNLTQTFSLSRRDVFGTVDAQVADACNNIDYVKQALRREGFSYFTLQDSDIVHHRRSQCDRCHLAKSFVRPELCSGHDGTCHLCQSNSLPCTFTSGHRLKASNILSERLRKALLGPVLEGDPRTHVRDIPSANQFQHYFT
ncbi:hypothetical protein BFW01_g5810 [Lasiodiplodia theobromae]|nr:hypothetical protein BFW01_g5810 [Lasiodiplodia theobromae]